MTAGMFPRGQVFIAFHYPVFFCSLSSFSFVFRSDGVHRRLGTLVNGSESQGKARSSKGGVPLPPTYVVFASYP